MQSFDLLGAVLPLAQATGEEPAGGAATGEVVGATVGALVATTILFALLAAHRSGRVGIIDRAAALSARATGLPGWVALPSSVLGLSLLTAVIGMYWDISLHIDNGRDAGPLANPAHYLILIGLYGALFAGILAMTLVRERPSPVAVRLAEGWWAPLGALVIVACGAFALAGFPLDDFWHRLFGQDVTLWGPTHLMLIGGGSLAVLGAMMLMTEGTGGGIPDGLRGPRAMLLLRRALLVGGFLVALSTFQGEFDFGVPQFRMVLHPILIMLAAGVGLVTARCYLGRGGALYAVAGFVLIRGVLALLVGGVFDQTTPHFPLYLVEALVVELVFARAALRSPVATGALAGIGIGTLGLAAEWGWTQIWMPIPWNAGLLPEALVAGFAAAVAGGAVGGFVGTALTGGGLARSAAASPSDPARAGGRSDRALRRDHLGALVGVIVLVGLVGWGLPMSTDGPTAATVALRDVDSGPDRTVAATIRIRPADAAADAELLNVTAWQGGASLRDPLERVGPGVYRTTIPIPVHGGWKAMVRLQRDAAIVAVPIYLPADRAIPAPSVPAEARFTRAFQADHELLQRERKQDVPGWISTAAYLTVLAIVLSLGVLLAWALLRLEAGGGARRGPAAPPKRTSPSAVEAV